MAIAETLMTFVMVMLLLFCGAAIGYKYGQSHFDTGMVDRANMFVTEYCSKTKPLIDVNNTFSIENGIVIVKNVNV